MMVTEYQEDSILRDPEDCFFQINQPLVFDLCLRFDSEKIKHVLVESSHQTISNQTKQVYILATSPSHSTTCPLLLLNQVTYRHLSINFNRCS